MIESMEARRLLSFTATGTPNSAYLHQTTKIQITAPSDSFVSTLSDSKEKITFSKPMLSGDAPPNWGSPPANESADPPTLARLSSTVTITFAPTIREFGLEMLQDNISDDVQTLRAVFYNGATVVGTVARKVDAASGARLFAASTREVFTKVVLSTQTGISFSVAQVRYRTRALGIDVSSHQGSINWAKVPADISYEYARATLGNGDWSPIGIGNQKNRVDATVTANVSGAQHNQILAGVYHVGRPTKTTVKSVLIADAQAEASYFAQKAGSYMGKGYLQPVLDFEPLTTQSGKEETWYLSRALTSTWVNAFCNKLVQLKGVRPIIYVGAAFAAKYLDATVTSWNLWIARYNNKSPSTGNPGSVTPWTNWTIWQYDYRGSIAGIAGEVDVDVLKDKVDPRSIVIA